MLRSEMNYADLIRSSRERAGLSMRELAERARVAASTVSRIEADKVSPSAATVDRLLLACGRERQDAPADAPAIASLADAWNDGGARPDWTRVRALLDALDAHPEYQSSATLEEPGPSGSPIMDNLMAGLAETIADGSGFRPPGWTRQIEPLTEPWAQPGTPRMLAARKETTPRRLANRHLIVDSESLWRHPVDVD